MKFTYALLVAAATGGASAAAISATTATVVTDRNAPSTVPVSSPPPVSTYTISPSLSASPTTVETPNEPSYPPATGTPGPIDQQIDAVVEQLRSDVLVINAKYNQTCSRSCGASHIQAWGDEHAKAADVAVARLQRLPASYVYWWYPRLVWNLGWIWIEIYYSLWFIWGRAGLLWEIIYFNRYLWNFYISWRSLFWYFGRFGG
ncbi:hypothetical protein DRE_01205 [Drechslerella stenobrocha 248]|uniref:Uncharacterized protein n=1 Tax=Drechslerella stenobrocha 248 TaxID=1043628 RepID=W7HMN6_9PEZI|nr:hypothetical protein DRE_01205 [Drechslerella stenobrocha 248]